MSEPVSALPEEPALPGGGVAPMLAGDRIAAIDIGSNSVRVVVAVSIPGGGYRVLDEERENTRLAASLVETDRLTGEAMDATVAALKSFVTMAQGYGVTAVRAIATSAVRDATNGRDFCRRVKDEVELEVEVIPPREEGRLSFLSVARAFDVTGKQVAVADIGGGSTEIVLASEGIVDEVYATRLGAVRVAEACALTGECDTLAIERAERFIDSELKKEIGKLPFAASMLYGAGGTFTAMAAMLMAREAGAADEKSTRGYRANRAEVRHLLLDLAGMTLEERGRVPGLNPKRADIIVAGLLVIERVMRRLWVNVVQVHTGGVRDGLLLTMIADSRCPARSVTPADRRDAVERFAHQCGADLPHARHVAQLAGKLLETLAEPLGLDAADRTLLETAALLANVGYLINFDGHHKHSYHLIRNSDLPGFERHELRLVATIARYHRGSRPKQKHDAFAPLSPADQDRVARLAAILRLALALDRTHQQQVRDLRANVSDDRVEIVVEAVNDAELDLWAARRKVDLFERVFNRPVVFTAATS
ncbi:MAG: Ppx/GppA phosphatase family protein [Lacipirellulaceae bacterium]